MEVGNRMFNGLLNALLKPKKQKSNVDTGFPKPIPEEPHSTETSSSLMSNNTFHQADAERFPQDDMAQDLAVEIGNAINDWAIKYHLEGLPRDIILDQAIAIIQSVKRSMK